MRPCSCSGIRTVASSRPTVFLAFLYPRACKRSYSSVVPPASYPRETASAEAPLKLSLELEKLINSSHPKQNLPLKRQTPVRANYDGTMTLGERERFSKIFETILSTRASPALPRDETTISFHPDAGTDAQDLRMAVTPENQASEQAARAYLKAYPPVLRQEAEQAVSNLKQRKLARQRQAKSTALRSAPFYLALKEQLFACVDSVALEEYIQEAVFGPFSRGEIDLTNKTKRKASMAFCNAYPLLLADAMKIYRLSYHDHAAAIEIFERIKAHGITSIVIGANTLVYNELLVARWEGWRDVQDLLLTLEEMERNGVRWDDGTANILKKVNHDILTEIRAEGGAGLYWQSEDPVKLESFNKVQSSIVLENAERTKEKLKEVHIEE